jgi:uncharacterized protein YegP (UPF0339 family)
MVNVVHCQDHCSGDVNLVERRFVLKRGQTGSYHFNLVATNGEIIATSETYQSKASALNGIGSVQRHAAGAGIDDQTSG